ncbi:MAG: class I SAM-dependent methyltransferase [Sulfuricella sp.]|nr:class I SAM-dependent methyltransferase [Sulfuricella sp.]
MPTKKAPEKLPPLAKGKAPAPANFHSGLWGQTDEAAQHIYQGIHQAIEHIQPQAGIFLADNLFVWRRNLSFLDDRKFMAAVARNCETLAEQSIIWRHYILAWCAEQALGRKGDFVECGCYRGTSVRIICDYLDFAASGKKYYLYDLFEHPDDVAWHSMPQHGKKLCQQVRKRFADIPAIKVIKGRIPRSLEKKSPKKIAFLHLDLNNAESEIAALEVLFERVVAGGLIVLDDYGWLNYHAQKSAADRFFKARGLRPMELPTGQALLIKP